MKNQIGNRGNNESRRSSWNYETSRLLKKNVTLAVADQCDLCLRRLHEPRSQWGNLWAVTSDPSDVYEGVRHRLDSVGTLWPVMNAPADGGPQNTKKRKTTTH